MSENSGNFLIAYLKGKALESDIDDHIDRWHSGEGEMELHEFLGFTEEEYRAWVRDPKALYDIARARRYQTPFEPAQSSNAEGDVRLAARESSAQDTAQALAFIKKVIAHGS